MNLFWLRSKRLHAWLSIYILALGYSGVVFGENDYLRNCPIKKGESLAKVQGFYQITREPQAASRPRPGSYYSSYHLQQYGVWVFFDNGKKVQSLRFDHPFAGKIEGVSVGDSKTDVIKLKGEPARQFEGLPDFEILESRKKRKIEIIENLPDPSPKELVRKAFGEITQIDSRPPTFNVAWLYQSTERKLLRYDFGSLSGKVQSILTDRGTDAPGTADYSQLVRSLQFKGAG